MTTFVGRDLELSKLKELARLLPPAHSIIDNTLPSIAAAFALDADVVEIDVRRTKDNQFVLFHDYALDCRTDAMGIIGPVLKQHMGRKFSGSLSPSPLFGHYT